MGTLFADYCQSQSFKIYKINYNKAFMLHKFSNKLPGNQKMHEYMTHHRTSYTFI